MKRLFLSFVSIFMTLILLAGCAQSAATITSATSEKSDNQTDTTAVSQTTEQTMDPADLPVLRVAVIPVVSSLPIQYIIDKNWDIENGFKIEKVVFSSGAPMGEALVSNLWDIGIMSAAGVFATANYDAMCIADTSDSIGYRGIGVFARPDSDIAAVKGSNPTYPNLYGDANTVKGKTILCPTGTLSQLQVTKWLEKIGLKDTDVNLVHMEYAQAYQAFISGQGDMVALNPPFCFSILNDGMIDVAPAEELEIKLNDMVFANKKTIEDNKTIITKCIELIYKAGGELEADQTMKEAALGSWYKINGSEVAPEILKSEAKKKLYTLEDIAAMESSVGSTLLTTADFFASVGKIETDKLPVIKSNINDEIIKGLLG